MDLKDMMQCNNFVVVGDTLNEEKYAYKIKSKLQDKGYSVECVGKELGSINDVEKDIEILVMCVHPAKGIKLLQENTKKVTGVILQPGAESEEIVEYLESEKYTYIQGCTLVGLQIYSK